MPTPRISDEERSLRKYKRFLQKAEEKHSDKYLYLPFDALDDYRVRVFCKFHGEFIQPRHKHLSNGGCRLCGVNERAKKRTRDTQWFVARAREVHGEKFDYSESFYAKSKELLKIKCGNGHIFYQSPNTHLSGHECPHCQKIGKPYWETLHKVSFEEFVERSIKTQNDQYDYSKSRETFENIDKHVLITCKIHGDFWQQAKTHMNGCQGCKRCHTKWRAEHRLLDLIKVELPNVKILHQFSPNWLGKQKFDIYIPDHNIAVEYNGQQHYHPLEYFGGMMSFIGQVKLDNRKRQLCVDNECKLFEVPYFFNTNQVKEVIEKIRVYIFPEEVTVLYLNISKF